jgi:hypothetical protein
MRIVAGATFKTLDGGMALFAMHAAETVILGTPCATFCYVRTVALKQD